MIIDVRNNPGGLLSSVVKITDMLIPQGCIVYTENKQGARNYEYSDKNAIDMPLVVLINGNSASASEVLAGAVRDSGIGVLVGEQSYGKGLVQDLKLLSDGSAIKVTVAKYYTPNGISINGVGITPDYIEPMDMGIRRVIDLKLEEDSQLMKALNVIEQKK
jgi:carboxyl-terminal processing protease